MITVRRLLIPLAVLALFGAACGNGDDSGPGEVAGDLDELGRPPRESVPVDTSTGSIPDVLRPGVQVTSVDFTTGVAVITNLGERDIDLTGYWICNRPTYAELPAEVIVPGQEIAASLGGFPAEGGEVAVYRSNDFGDPDAIVAYVSWGGGGGRQGIAEQAGIWEGDPVQPSGDTIELTGDPGSADGWT